MLDLLLYGFAVALTPTNLFYCFTGVFFGTLVGVLPGIGALPAITLLLPITYYLDPTGAVIMLAGVYYGAEYGGSTASALLNIPGTPSNAITCLDGYPMTKQGRAGVALFMTSIASFAGGTIGILLLTLLTPAIVMLTFAFQPADYFALMLCALVAAGAVTQGAPLKGLAMVVVGLLLGGVGIDPNTGAVRFSAGFMQLYEGIGLVPMAMGLFGVAEILASIGRARGAGAAEKVTLRSMVPTRKDISMSTVPILRGSGVGSFFGALPGAGATIASFVAYAVERRVAKDPSRFGKGAIEGLTAPESANNASAQTAFIPTLSLGIPGSVTMAIILGALMIHGVTPGPRLITDHPEIFWGLIASFWIGNIMLLFLNIPLIGVWVWLVQIPYKLLFPSVIALLCIGVYAVGNSTFDVGLVLVFGIIGYFMRIGGYPAAPVLIGFVLGADDGGKSALRPEPVARRFHGVNPEADQRRVPRACRLHPGLDYPFRHQGAAGLRPGPREVNPINPGDDYMKAAILAESGLRVADIPPPEIGPGEVLVRVRSAGLNRADTLRAAGAFHGSRDSPGTVLGLEWAGEVVQTGTGVENFRAGDRVMCAGQGGYAEFAKAHAEDCMHIPEEIDGYEKMAVLPIAMRTMHDAIVTNGRMSAGETVLVQGAATGVGLLGLQIARALGARLVIGTSTRAERRARLAEFGADLALDSTDSNWPEAVLEATDGHGVDLIIDQISGAVVLGNLRAAAIRGRIVNVGRLGAGEGDFDYEMHAAKRITYIGVTFRSRSEEEKHTVSRLAYAALGPDLTAGRYHLPIDRAFRLEEINEAHAYMRANNHFGKIAVTI